MMPAAVSQPMEQAALANAASYIDPGAESAGDGRKQKRELSQSKRAAQNRAAQVSTLVPSLSLSKRLVVLAWEQPTPLPITFIA